MNLHFQHIQYAWLFIGIIAIVALFIYLDKWKQEARKRMGDPALIKLLTGSFSGRLFKLKYGVLTIAFALGVFAIMNLQKPGAADGLSRKGIDVVIALDVSRSMLAADMPPNRLERAKQLINKLMNSMPDDRFALILFAGKAYMQLPLTTDHGAAAMFVSTATPDAVPEQGTVISEALDMSATVFNNIERRFKAVILISDGEDHDAEAVKTATRLADQGMMISTVGIGSPEGSYIPDPATGENKKDDAGSQVISKLNEEELQAIASASKGVYVRLQDSDDAVSRLRQQLSQIDRIALDDVSLVNFKTYYWIFAGAMLLLLIGEFFIPETRKRKLQKKQIPLKEELKKGKEINKGDELKKANEMNKGKEMKSARPLPLVLLLLLGIISSPSTHAQLANPEIRKGNELYRQQQFTQAGAAYADAMKKDPADLTSKYNRSIALYRAGNTADAMKELDDINFKSLVDGLKEKAWYNKGVMLSGQQKLEESIEAYKSALRLDPTDKDARENLQKALQELKKKEPPKQDNKPQPQPDKKQQQQPQPQPQMNKQEAEQRLKLLEQKEKEVQQRLQKERSGQGGAQTKDW